MEYIKATENTILMRLTKAGTDYNITLTHANKVFYIRLLKLAETNGYEVSEGLAIDQSIKQLAGALNIPSRTITQSINRLVGCGALLRVSGNKTFPRSATRTIIYKSFYEKEK